MVYVLNKQVSNYMAMAFFSSKISLVPLVLTGYGFVTMCALRVFSIARQLNTRLVLTMKLNIACPEYYIGVKNHIPCNDVIFL